MKITDFVSDASFVESSIPELLREMFGKNTLVINDTRLLIASGILPHIPFVGGYDQRIVSILPPGSCAIFSKPFSDEVHHYYQSLGLALDIEVITVESDPGETLTASILANEDLISQLRSRGFDRLINIGVDENTEKLASCIGAKTLFSTQISRLANDKLELKRFLQSASLPTIDGIYASDRESIEDYYFRDAQYLFKDPHGVSGYGFWSNKKHTLAEIISGAAHREIIIEKCIVKDASPSVQFAIYENNSELSGFIYAITDQILQEEQHYIGNTSPSVYVCQVEVCESLLSQSRSILAYLSKLGFRGIGGIDFMVSGTDVYATEVNARLTGATYPALASFLLGNTLFTPWSYSTIEGSNSTISQALGGSIQDAGGQGVFPVCIASLELYGKAQLLTIGGQG